MQIWVGNNERADLDLQGAGSVVLGGRGRLLKASLGGLGSLNAKQFEADAVNLELSGLGNATVNAHECQAEPERTRFGGGVRQAGQPRCQRRWPGQGQLEVSAAKPGLQAG
jgi:hypothetical protein